MVQDFAKSGRRGHHGAVRQAPEADPQQAPAWTLLLTGGAAGTALGLCLGFLVYLSGLLPPPPGQRVSATIAPEAPTGNQSLSEELERAAQRLQLEFYRELPNYEVVVDITPLELPPWQRPQPAIPDSTAADSPPLITEVAPAADEATDGSPLPEGLSLAEEAPAAVSTAAETARDPQPTPASTGPNYLLQVGAYQQENSAQQQRDRLLSLGLLDSYVRQEALLGRTLYLVQTGPYSREQASQVERMLRSNNIDSMRITAGNR